MMTRCCLCQWCATRTCWGHRCVLFVEYRLHSVWQTWSPGPVPSTCRACCTHGNYETHRCMAGHVGGGVMIDACLVCAICVVGT